MYNGSIFQMTVENSTGIVYFGVPGEAVNTWTEEAMTDFNNLMKTLLDEPALQEKIKGLIFISTKKNNFHAGANLRFMEKFSSKEELKHFIDRLHRSFNQLESLGVPTVAAINGQCLGGGYEFALACTARVATDSNKTIIGLPECTVGLFPGGGGTQRLPRLIGYPAVELILKGKVVPAGKAHKLGMVDQVFSKDEDLLKNAAAFLDNIASDRTFLKRPEHDFSKIDEIIREAGEKILSRTRGRKLPAHTMAMKAMQDGLKVPLEEGLEIEKSAFLEAALAPEAKGSINTFFLKTATDKPEKLTPKDFKPREIKKTAVLGFGTMGRGIALEILRNMKIPVLVIDKEEALQPGRDFMKKKLSEMAEKGKIKDDPDTLLELLSLSTEINENIQDAGLVIEAVFEDINTKDEVYKTLCRYVTEDCIITSNTSTIPITKLAQSVTGPERFAGTHFFSPVWQMELLEIIRGEKTSDDTVNNLLTFASSIKKRPLVCNDNPGFVVNALLFPYFTKVFELLEKGVPVEKIDTAMREFGMPVGPVKLIDEVGIDIPYKSLIAMGAQPPQFLKNVVESGRLGLKKSGKGFFLQDGSVDPEIYEFLPGDIKPVEMDKQQVQNELYAEFVKKGRELLKDNVVDDPRAIDTGMIWGVGFPPDKGGPLKWADLTGLSEELVGEKFYK